MLNVRCLCLQEISLLFSSPTKPRTTPTLHRSSPPNQSMLLPCQQWRQSSSSYLTRKTTMQHTKDIQVDPLHKRTAKFGNQQHRHSESAGSPPHSNLLNLHYVICLCNVYVPKEYQPILDGPPHPINSPYIPVNIPLLFAGKVCILLL